MDDRKVINSMDPQTNPLLVGCSGGGGHNAAIQAIAQGYAEINLIFYEPVKADAARIQRIQNSPQYKKNY